MRDADVLTMIRELKPNTTRGDLDFIAESVSGILATHGDDAPRVFREILRQIATTNRYKSVTLAQWQDACGAVLTNSLVFAADPDAIREEEYAAWCRDRDRVRRMCADMDREELHRRRAKLAERFPLMWGKTATAKRRGKGDATVADPGVDVGDNDADDPAEWTHMLRCWATDRGGCWALGCEEEVRSDADA
jgi:hypothetical protein